MRARWYDPTLGRFISKDPIGLAGGINRYCYAANNPTRYADPFGLKICFSGDPELIKMYIDYMETVGIPFKNKQKLKDKIKDGCLCFDESEIDLKKVKSGKLPQTLVDILTHSDPIRFKLVANDNGVTLGANEIGQQTLDLGDFARLDQTQGIPDAVKLNLMTHELGEAIISQTEGVGWGTSHPPAVSDYENTGIRSSGGDWQRGGNLNRLQYQDGQGNHYEIMPMDPSPQFPAGRFQVTPRWLP